MSSPYRRLVARGRLAAIPVVIAAAVAAGVVERFGECPRRKPRSARPSSLS